MLMSSLSSDSPGTPLHGDGGVNGGGDRGGDRGGNIEVVATVDVFKAVRKEYNNIFLS